MNSIRKLIKFLIDLFLLNLSVTISIFLKYEQIVVTSKNLNFFIYCNLSFCIIYVILKIYNNSWRFSGISEYITLITLSASTSLLSYMVRVFFNSYRVRLPKFRKGHKICTSLVMLFLIFNWSAIIFNQIFYLFLSDPTKHLTYKFDVAKELADKLKEAGVQDIATEDTRLALRLKFYGIKTKYIIKKGSILLMGV